MLVKDYISFELERLGIEVAFGVSGANIEDLYSAIEKRKKIKVVLAKNEYNASMMAIGSYLASKNTDKENTKKCQVVLTTSGAGILNTIPILAEGYSSRLPFVVISGTVPEELEGMGAFQDTSGKGGSFDLLDMLSPCTEKVFKVSSVREIPMALAHAFSASQKAKRPSVILIPKNMFNQEMPNEHFLDDESSEETINEDQYIKAKSFLEEVISLGKAPLVILGEELVHLKDLKSINLFIKNLKAKVAVTPTAKGLYDHFDCDFLGLTGVMGHEEVIQHLKECTHLILIGTQFDMISRFGLEKELSHKKILVMTEFRRESLFKLGAETIIEVVGSSEKILGQLFEEFHFHNDFPISLKTKKLEKSENNKTFSYVNSLQMIESSLSKEADLFVDAGNCGAFSTHYLNTRGEGVFYISLGMGGMGNSIGASIGSCFLSRKKSYVFLGDGSFFMHGLEIHTAIEHDLPLTFIIFNNNAHAMCSTREDLFLGGETGVNNFKKSHLGLGLDKIFTELQSFEINSIEELNKALSKNQNYMRPCLMSLNISDKTLPPFRTFFK